MSLLVYKQRFVNPNYKTTASKNYAHIRYIATRPRVAKNEGMNHGLFGKLAPGAIEEFADCRDVARLAYRKSKQHIVMYRSVISFSEETAKELMLTDQKAWQRYIENHIMTIAEKNKMKREHLQWACALHQEKNHPHIHVVFWDTSAKVRNPYTHPAVPNAIRRQMIKDTFAHRIREYGKQKNSALKGLRQLSDELVDDYERHIRRMDRRRWEFLKEEATLEHELEGAFDFDDQVLEQAAEQIFRIWADLPEKGRIAYQLLPPEVKIQVDQLVTDLLKQVPALQGQKADYVNSKMQMVQLYGGSNEYMGNMRSQFAKEADKVIANRMLGMMKSMNRMEAEWGSADRIREQKLSLMEQMILEALEMLAALTGAADRQNQDWNKHHGELSKEARKELYLKLQDKGYEH